MAKELDNIKMWESVRKSIDEQPLYHWLACRIDTALEDQGFEYKDGKIISIMSPKEENDHVSFRWYVCTKEYFLQCEGEYYFLFEKGKIYKTYVDDQGGEWITADDGHSYKFDYSAYFRPATEEEIAAENSFQSVWPEGYAKKCAKEWAENPPKGYNEELRKFCKAYLMATDGLIQEQYFKVGDRVRRKGTNVKGDVITNIYESGGITMYEFENSDDAPQSFDWELVEPEELHNKPESNELTEFEQGLQGFCELYADEEKNWENWDESDAFIKRRSKEILSIARKQIVSEIDTKELYQHAQYIQGDYTKKDMDRAYRYGIQDVLNKIKKGEEV